MVYNWATSLGDLHIMVHPGRRVSEVLLVQEGHAWQEHRHCRLPQLPKLLPGELSTHLESVGFCSRPTM